MAGWLCQFFITLVGFNWVAYTISHFGQFPWIVGVMGFLLFASFAHLHIPLALGVWHLLITYIPLFKNKRSAWLLLPTLSAFFFSLIPMLFKWNLGYPWLWINLPAAQTAEIWGFEFLSTLSFFFQLVFLSLTCKKIFKKVFPLGILFFIGLNVWGYFLVQKWPLPEKKARILMVQHNIGNYVHSQTSLRKLFQSTLRLLNNMTEAELEDQNADFIVWPEGAYPYLISQERTPFRTQYLQRTVRENFKTPLITGGSAAIQDDFTNSIFFLDQEGEFFLDRYDKNYLLAFGEYLPGEKWFPFLREFFLGSRKRLLAGNENPALRKVKDIQLGVQICYEGLRAELSRKATQKGAQILLNITNDSWFGKRLEPEQHLYLTLGRVIETRRPMVRLSTVGYSVAINAHGDILTKSPLHQKWSQIVELPYEAHPEQTIFVRWGYLINFLFLFFVFISLIFINIVLKRLK